MWRSQFYSPPIDSLLCFIVYFNLVTTGNTGFRNLRIENDPWPLIEYQMAVILGLYKLSAWVLNSEPHNRLITETEEWNEIFDRSIESSNNVPYKSSR